MMGGRVKCTDRAKALCPFRSVCEKGAVVPEDSECGRFILDLAMEEGPIKAITIWQPYASLLVGQKFKHFETRGWATSYKGPIAIHAAKRPPMEVVAKLDADTRDRIKGAVGPGGLDLLPTGAIIGIGVLERCNAITEEFVGSLSPMELCLGDYRPGRFAWEFSGMYFIDPIPATGKQGFWTWPGPKEAPR